VAKASSGPGKPWRNGAAESFTGKFRDQYLNIEGDSPSTELKLSANQLWRSK
jgi:putative transposase